MKTKIKAVIRRVKTNVILDSIAEFLKEDFEKDWLYYQRLVNKCYTPQDDEYIDYIEV